MSEYIVIKCDISSHKHIIEGLKALGIPEEVIEYHKIPVPLYGFLGDKRDQKANVVVRKEIINKYLSGGASNDLGFELVNGEYQVRVSQYDRTKWWESKREEFFNECAYAKTAEKLKKRGYKIKREDIDGEIVISYSKKF